SELAELSEKASGAGLEDLILDPGTRGFGDSLVTLTQMRRLALKKAFRPMGYPTITFPGEAASSLEEEAVLAGQHIAKYGGIVVLDRFSPAAVYPLLTLRLNIYTDPQKPIQMKPGIYPIGEPKDTS
ncbi:MAG: acetyl-CoA decarbonylase/synthase complex subunit gamma, partial [Chloroflexi bacterium CG07_land_8_20_14_0_80_51_10]